MFRSTTDFCVLILYPANLPNLFIRADSLCVVSLGFLYATSFHLWVEIISTSSFPMGMHIFSFSCPAALDRPWRTTLNRSSQGEHSCLVPVVEGKASRVSLLSIMLVMWFKRCPLSAWGSSLPFQLFYCLFFFFFFYHRRVLRFIKLFLHLLRWPRVLCSSLYWYGAFHWLTFTC